MPALSPHWKIAALAVFALMWSLQARAAEQVAIRAYDHGDFGRFVFDWKNRSGIASGSREISSPSSSTGRWKAPSLRSSNSFPITSPQRASMTMAARRCSISPVPRPPNPSIAAIRSRSISAALRMPRHPFNPPNPIRASKTASAEKSPSKSTADLLSVRFGTHDDYSRIVFDWPSAVPYTAFTDGNTLKLEFAVPAQIDMDRLRADLPRFVTAMDAQTRAGGLTVTIAGADAARFHHFRSENKIVVDIAGSEHALLPADGPDPKSPPANDQKTAKPQPGTPAPRARVLVAELPDIPGGNRPVTSSPTPSPPGGSAPESAPVRLLPDKSGSPAGPAATAPSSSKPPQTSSGEGVPSSTPASIPAIAQMLTS